MEYYFVVKPKTTLDPSDCMKHNDTVANALPILRTYDISTRST